MALAARTVHAPCAAGIDESTRPELLEPGASALVLENVRADRRGGYTKRLGYDYLELGRLDGSSRSAGRKLFTLGERTCVVDGTQLDVYSEQVGAWVNAGRVSECSVRLTELASTTGGAVGGALETQNTEVGSQPYVADIAYCNGVYVVAQSDGNNSVASVIDQNGVTIRSPELIGSSGVQVYSIALGTYGTTVVYVQSRVGGLIQAWTLDCSSSSGLNTGWVSRGNVAADRGATYPLAVASLSDRIAVAYANNSAGTNRLTITTFTTTVQQTATVNTSSVTPLDVALDWGASSDTLWCIWSDAAAFTGATNVRCVALQGTNLPTVQGTVASVQSFASASNGLIGSGTFNVTADPSSQTARFYVSTFGTGSNLTTFCRDIVISAGACAGSGTEVTTHGQMLLASKPTRYGGRIYALVLQYDDLSTTTFCDVTTGGTLRPVGVFEPSLVASVLRFDTPTNIALVYRRSLVARDSTLAGAVTLIRNTSRAATLVTLDFADRSRWQAVEHAGSAYMTGGVTMKFDGSRFREAGFIQKPVCVRGASVAGAVTLTNGGARHVAVFETADGDGNWIAGSVSNPTTSTGNVAGQQFPLTTRPCTLTARASSSSSDAERIAFYRSSDGGSIYYYVGAVANSTSSATIAFNDNVPEATLVTRPRLQSTGILPGTLGGQQDRRAPPGFSCLVAYNDMLVGAAGSTLWYSSQSIVGEGIWWNPIFRLDMVDGNDVTALAAQDGTLFVFKRRSIFAVAGEPPADNGSSGGLGTPRRLAVDVGCVDPRSVVVTALGIFFQSERGLELLTRAQSVEWIGEPVQTTLASYSVITSAVLDSAHALVRFTCAASETDNVVSNTGVHLVYDLTLKTWVSIDKVTNNNNASRAAQSASMVYLGGSWRYAYLDKDGRVSYEELASSATAHLDHRGAYWVAMRWEVPSFRLGLQQEQRAWNATLLFERHSDSVLSVETAYDYASTYDTPRVWTSAELTTAARQIEIRPKPRGQAVRFRFTDSAPVTLGTGKGCTWIGLSVDIAPKQGSTRGTPRLDPTVRK